MTKYPPCELSKDYPILAKIPPEERRAYVEQAERGEPLNQEQLRILGFHPSFTNLVLLPKDAKKATQAQMDVAFPPSPQRDAALHEIMQILLRAKTK